MSGVPMTMDEWNLRMRAQKEHERKQKTESAEILRGYRGGEVSEDDRKVAAQREEERRKKMEAQQNLREHQYREKLVEERERRQRKDQDMNLPPVVVKQEDAIEFESVAAKAAQFNSPGKAPLSFESPRKLSGFRIQPSTSDDVDKEEKGNEYEDESSGPTRTFDTAPPFGSDGVGVSDVSMEQTQHTGQLDGSDEDYEEENDDEKKAEIPDPALVSPGDPPLLHHPTVVRLDVNFSFGLITTSAKPVLDTYMLAVEAVVRETLEEQPHLSQRVSYDPKFGPFVQDCVNDDNYVDAEGRESVRRVLVTSSVPVFLSNGVSISVARDAVVSGLRQAIESGHFLELALGSTDE